MNRERLERALTSMEAAKAEVDAIREELGAENDPLDSSSRGIRYEIERLEGLLQLLDATAPRKLNPVA